MIEKHGSAVRKGCVGTLALALILRRMADGDARYPAYEGFEPSQGPEIGFLVALFRRKWRKL
jgi:hypothetical protein